MGLDVTSGTIFAFVLVLTRTSALLVGLPAVGGELIPMRVRAALALTLSYVVILTRPEIANDAAPALAILGEAMVGGAMGLLLRAGLAAADLMGELVSSQGGFGFDRFVSPFAQEQSSIVAHIVTLTVGVVLFASGAYREVIRGLCASFVAVPPGTLGSVSGLSALLVERAGALFVSGVRIAAPVAGVLFATQMALGLLARIAPQLNVWALGFLITSGMTVGALALLAPALVDELGALWHTALGDLAFGNGG